MSNVSYNPDVVSFGYMHVPADVLKSIIAPKLLPVPLNRTHNVYFQVNPVTKRAVVQLDKSPLIPLPFAEALREQREFAEVIDIYGNLI